MDKSGRPSSLTVSQMRSTKSKVTPRCQTASSKDDPKLDVRIHAVEAILSHACLPPAVPSKPREELQPAAKASRAIEVMCMLHARVVILWPTVRARCKHAIACGWLSGFRPN